MAFPDGWGRKCVVTIDADEVDGALTDFPVLLTEDNLPSEMFDADGANPALNGGGDIRFSSDEAGTTQLPCEVVSFVTDNDPVNGTAQIWVKVPSVSASVDTDFYVWYKKSGESQPSASDTYGSQNVWDSGFVAVWHMEQDPSGSAPQVLDSTSNGRHATSAGSMTSGDVVAGTIGSAIDFDGADDRLSFSSPEITTITMECIVRFAGWGDSSFPRLIEMPGYTINGRQGTSSFGLDGNHSSANGTWRTPSSSIALSTDYHLAGTLDKTSTGNNAVLYINGASQTVTEEVVPTGTPTSNSGTGYIANRSAADRSFQGWADEMRISNVIRNAAWVDATSSTCRTPATFALAGTPEDHDAGGGETAVPALYLSGGMQTLSGGLA